MNVLVTGGSASGKSAYAEELACSLASPHIYVATMRAFGEEGAVRVRRHREQRAGKGFATVECACGLGGRAALAAVKAAVRAGAELGCAADAGVLMGAEALAGAGYGVPAGCEALAGCSAEALAGTVLLEDVGNLVANELYGEDGAERGADAAVSAAVDGVMALTASCENVVAVTNEVGADGAVLDASTQRYVRCLGAVSNQLAARFDVVVEVVCGFPRFVKGGLA